MRRIFSGLLVFTVLLSLMAFATPIGPVGIKVTSSGNGPNSLELVEYKDVDSWQYEINPYQELLGQDVAITLDARAFIPCYLELSVGNDAENFAQVESFGPNGFYNETLGIDWLLVFDNELGGFVDSQWQPIYGLVTPEDGRFIKAHVDLTAKAYSNDNYMWQVEAGPLTFVNDGNVAPLDLHMLIKGIGTHKFTSYSSSNICPLSSGHINATEYAKVDLAFRVPYTRSIRHGEYKGAVTVRAFTI